MPYRVKFIDGHPGDVVRTDERIDGMLVFRSFGLARTAALQDLNNEIRWLRNTKGHLSRLRVKDLPELD